MISRGRTPTASMLQFERTGIRTGSFIRNPRSCVHRPPAEGAQSHQSTCVSHHHRSAARAGSCGRSRIGPALKTWLRQARTAARLCVVMHLLMSEEPRLSLPRPRRLTCSAAFLASRESMTVRASTCLGIAELGVILDGDRRRSASILRRKCLAICRPPGTSRYLLSIYHRALLDDATRSRPQSQTARHVHNAALWAATWRIESTDARCGRPILIDSLCLAAISRYTALRPTLSMSVASAAVAMSG